MSIQAFLILKDRPVGCKQFCAEAKAIARQQDKLTSPTLVGGPGLLEALVLEVPDDPEGDGAGDAADDDDADDEVHDDAGKEAKQAGDQDGQD